VNKKLLLVSGIFVFLILGYFTYQYLMFGGGRVVSEEEPVYQVLSNEIKADFSRNLQEANLKYLNKPITVFGEVTSINQNEIIIDSSIICSFTLIDSSVKINEKLLVKGRVIGYDELFGEIKLDQCNQQK
jgi:hypothetical protein